MSRWTIIFPRSNGAPSLKVHEGYEWLFVLCGRMGLVLGDRDLVVHARAKTTGKKAHEE